MVFLLKIMGEYGYHHTWSEYTVKMITDWVSLEDTWTRNERVEIYRTT